MSAPSNDQILFRLGGAEYQRTGRLWRRRGHGRELGAPVFIRADGATCAIFRGRDGLAHLAAANVPRIQWFDLDGDGLYETAALLIEQTATNSLLRSRALATGSPGWNGGTNATPANGAAVGLDGVAASASSLTPTTLSTNLHYGSQDIGISSGEFIAAQAFIRPNPYTGVTFRVGDPSSTNAITMNCDLSAGTVLGSSAGGAGVLGGATIEKWVALSSGIVFYRLLLWGALNASLTSARLFIFPYDTGAHAQSQTAYAGDGTSGLIVDFVGFERNGVIANIPPTSPLVTLGSTVTRAADLFYLPIGFGPLPISIYVKHLERGASARSGGVPAIFNLGDGSSGTPRLLLTQNLSYGARYLDGVHATQAPAVAGATVYGDVIEDAVTLTAAAVCQISQAINGGVVTVGSPSAGGFALAPAWAQPRLYLGNAGPATAIVSLLGATGVFALPDLQAVA